jgi:pyruvate kinase
MSYRRRTKIVATIGPASSSEAVLQRLIRAGMDVARLNFSHGAIPEHAACIDIIRTLKQRMGANVAVLIDLPGPKYRIGRIQGGQVALKRGSIVRLSPDTRIEGNASLLPVTLPNLSKGIKEGDTVLLHDGVIQLKVQEIDDSGVVCRVTVGGMLMQGHGLVVPGMSRTVPFMTPQLRQGILFAVKQKPDFLALSFVNSAADIDEVRKILHDNRADIPLIAKIERSEAVNDLNRILAASDGIMVARGDLGVEMPLERVPLIQKEIIKKCNRAGKPVITATEMLESMITEVRPTRAETTDVANAIFDGTDAVMLSAETAIGKYPVPAVEMMARIARAAEKELPYEQMLTERRSWLERETDELISYSACQAAHSLRAAAIVAFTQSGSTAIRVSKYRPRVPILALTSSDIISGRLLLYWGVYPVRVEAPASVDEIFAVGSKYSRDNGIAKPGDLIVIAAGTPIGKAGSTNMLKVEKIAG